MTTVSSDDLRLWCPTHGEQPQRSIMGAGGPVMIDVTPVLLSGTSTCPVCGMTARLILRHADLAGSGERLCGDEIVDNGARAWCRAAVGHFPFGHAYYAGQPVAKNMWSAGEPVPKEGQDQ